MYEEHEVRKNKDPSLEIEKRFVKGEIRIEGDGKPLIHGYAAVFNQKSEDLGGFREYVKPGAFTKTLQESDVRCLFNHDPNYVLGRTSNGTLKLVEDDLGLHYEVDPPDTGWARDLCASIKRGDIDQSSFGFKTVKDEWHTEGGEQVRYLQECRLFDVSPVTQPAYPQTSVACRAMLESLISREPSDTGHSGSEPGNHSEERRRIQKALDEMRLMKAMEA